MKITFTGPAAAGKGTIAKRLATELGIPHVDLGRVFRAVAYLFYIGQAKSFEEAEGLIDSVIDNSELLTDEIAKYTAQLAATRDNLLALCAISGGFIDSLPDVVCDGRSAGTLILPNADYKFYVTASEEIRASRRCADLNKLGYPSDYEQVLADVRERDQMDRQREYDPLQIPIDAIVINTDHHTAETAVAYIRLQYIRG